MRGGDVRVGVDVWWGGDVHVLVYVQGWWRWGVHTVCVCVYVVGVLAGGGDEGRWEGWGCQQ